MIECGRRKLVPKYGRSQSWWKRYGSAELMVLDETTTFLGASVTMRTRTTCGAAGRQPTLCRTTRRFSIASTPPTGGRPNTCASLLLNDKSPPLSTGTTSRLLTHFIRFLFQLNTNSHLINQL